MIPLNSSQDPLAGSAGGPHRRRVVVVGSGGRLGGALVTELARAGHAVTSLARAQLDITSADAVASVLGALRPEVIVNCTAFNAVDAAERDPAAAFAVNAHGPAYLACAAEATGALLVHYGTDFVFDGTATSPYREEDATNPLSVYGASKLAGEHEVRATPRHYVIRLESLFGGCPPRRQRATIDWIVDNVVAGSLVRVALDRTVSPSYVPDVVRATRRLIERDAPYGTYHGVASGITTWYRLATTVAHHLGVSGCIAPVTSAELNLPATRPHYCALSNHKLQALDIRMPGWQSALRRHITSRRLQAPASGASSRVEWRRRA